MLLKALGAPRTMILRIFLEVARGSSFEVQSLLFVGLDVGYVPEKQFEALFAHATSAISMNAGFTCKFRTAHFARIFITPAT
jgi:hypothetical protein